MSGPNDVLRPVFVGHKWCAQCSSPPELYCFRGGYVTICSQCTVRILDSVEDRLPFEFMVLEAEAARSVARRKAKESTPPTVEFDSFYRCHRCDRLLEKKAARYPDLGGGTLYPHCTDCYEAVAC